MMKSYVSFLEGLYGAILRDVAVVYPTSASEWKRDMSRLRLALEDQGLPFFTIDLPASGKHFDKCLSARLYTRSGLANHKPAHPRTPIPGLFQGLMFRVFQEDGTIRSDVDHTAVFFLRQLYYAVKKLRLECPPAAVYSTVRDFFDIENHIRKPDLNWSDDTLVFPSKYEDLSFSDFVPRADTAQLDLFPRQGGGCDPKILELLQRVCDRVVSSFGPLSLASMRPKHGPGVVADLKKGVSKYSFPTWPAKLEAIFPIDEFGFANLNAFEEDLQKEGLHYDKRRHEAPSRLITVPKTQKGPRLIAAEPTSHQWIQQAIWRELDGRIQSSLLGLCISIADQEKSRNDALAASQTGQRATIDLSSASDRLSCSVIERVFRSHRDLLTALHACRTRWLVNRIDQQLPPYIVLRKYAPMGSSLTFPVQSIVYAFAAITAVIYVRKWGLGRSTMESAARLVRVYGDDIIVPVDVCGVLIQLLTELGLKVNQTKTFTEGNFRESCGMDAYEGVDVTPAYVLEVCDETRPLSVVSTVASRNNFFKKGLLETASWLQSTVPSKYAKSIRWVSSDSGAFGWTSHGSGEEDHLKHRWNPQLHRWEVSALIPRMRSERRPIEGWQSLLQYFTEVPPQSDKELEKNRIAIRCGWLSSSVSWEAGLDSGATVGLSRRWVPAQAGGRASASC
jgi:hypothetical protein